MSVPWKESLVVRTWLARSRSSHIAQKLRAVIKSGAMEYQGHVTILLNFLYS
jgi:hypothetical protein